MTVYKDIDTINRFIQATPSDWGIYVHIDSKSNINIEDIRRYDYCIKKHKIYWGSWRHLYSFWQLLEEASKEQYDYYHLVTGQDYFATSPDKADDLVGKEGYSYFDIFTLPRKNWWEGGFSIYQYPTISLWFDIRKGYANFIHRKTSSFLRKYNIKQKLPIYPLYGGSVYCSLHNSLVQWMITDNETKRYLNALKYSLCGEEIFFQTVAMRSPYRNFVKNQSLRYIDWSCDNPPKILDLMDYSKIIESKSLFCRKINLENGLADKLDEYSK